MAKVKVRIAVGVDYNGNWCASGWGEIEYFNDFPQRQNNEIMMDSAIENLEVGENRYWVVAELEVPEKDKEIEEIEGDVANGE